MQQILIATLLVASHLCYGQSGTAEAPFDWRWRIGISASVDRCYRELRNTGTDPDADLFVALLNKHERATIGWSLGVDLSRRLGQHWSILAGAHYCRRGYRSEEFSGFIAEDPVETDPAIPLSSRYEHDYMYVEVPVLALFSLGAGRVQGLMGIGLRPGYLISAEENVRSEYGTGEVRFSSHSILKGKQEFSLMMVATAGATFRIASRFTIRLMPEARYGLISIWESDVKKNLWSLGATLGAEYHF